MALTAFLLLDGIKGSAKQKGREDHMTVHGVTHEVARELGFFDGQPGSKVQHKFLVVTKDVDNASPLLYEAMSKKDPIKFAQLRFFRMPPAGGPEENHYSIQLEEVTIASIKLKMEGRTLIHETEEIALAYKNIKWGWTARTAEPGKTEKERSQGGQNGVAFALPYEAYLVQSAKDIGKDLGKDIAKGIGSELYDAGKKQVTTPDPSVPKPQ